MEYQELLMECSQAFLEYQETLKEHPEAFMEYQETLWNIRNFMECQEALPGIRKTAKLLWKPKGYME